MFKLIVVSALFAIAAASHSHIYDAQVAVAHTPIVKSALISEPTSVEVHQPYVAKVGEIVRSEPSAVSHQHSTVVHSRTHSVTPILEKGVRTVHAPAVRTYETPVVAGYAATPIVKSVAATPIVSAYAAHAAPIAVAHAAHAAPIAVAHSAHAAPLAVAHSAYAAAPLALSHSIHGAAPLAGVAHSAYATPLGLASHTGHLGLAHAGHLGVAHSGAILANSYSAHGVGLRTIGSPLIGGLHNSYGAPLLKQW